MPLKSKQKSGNKFTVGIIILIMLLDLVFLYYLKYTNQNLSLAEFSINNIGNILNLMSAAAVIISIIIYSLQKKNKPNLRLLKTFTIILNVVLVLSAISIYVKLPLLNMYFLSQPLPEVIAGFLFLFYQFCTFVFISMIWMSMFGGKGLLFLRSLVNALITVIILFLFAFLYLNTKKSSAVVKPDSKDSTNVAVVLGAAVWSHNEPSPSLAARADKAAELFRKGYVGSVQLTGSNAPGELSEAEVAYNFIKNKNIDTTRVVIEKHTKSTSEQVEFIKNNILTRESINNVIIISDSYHLARIMEICKFYNVKAQLVSSDLMFSFENMVYYKLRESIAIILFWFFAI